MRSINQSNEIFTFHLVKIPFLSLPKFLFSSLHKRNIPGVLHSESFFTMNLGESIFSPNRYNLQSFAFFVWWREESFLDAMLNDPSFGILKEGWHVRMKLYRRWGEISSLKEATIVTKQELSEKPVVAVTLARLKLTQTLRFIKWGKPVEKQVKNHSGQILALAALRPLNTFSTFSIWKNESAMIDMVYGRDRQFDGESHQLAMMERNRKDFHYEFTTMRFTPFKEVGVWKGESNYLNLS
ncbi:hypothetical protein EHQ58_09285 [Leptospira ognonensis]|uniref:DUF3291 domain-containing protein n=1 Tax=Leptospira ognonensis TaxID=2484945 RepID=A0A4R9K0C4_9LEPT|nr:hypothetical protein [Leptospira ognonensis]TGL59099.1 hypothetical protein EHQ58_09285 [Leptospira ognonensis]